MLNTDAGTGRTIGWTAPGRADVVRGVSRLAQGALDDLRAGVFDESLRYAFQSDGAPFILAGIPVLDLNSDDTGTRTSITRRPIRSIGWTPATWRSAPPRSRRRPTRSPTRRCRLHRVWIAVRSSGFGAGKNDRHARALNGDRTHSQRWRSARHRRTAACATASSCDPPDCSWRRGGTSCGASWRAGAISAVDAGERRGIARARALVGAPSCGRADLRRRGEGPGCRRRIRRAPRLSGARPPARSGVSGHGYSGGHAARGARRRVEPRQRRRDLSQRRGVRCGRHTAHRNLLRSFIPQGDQDVDGCDTARCRLRGSARTTGRRW